MWHSRAASLLPLLTAALLLPGASSFGMPLTTTKGPAAATHAWALTPARRAGAEPAGPLGPGGLVPLSPACRIPRRSPRVPLATALSMVYTPPNRKHVSEDENDGLRLDAVKEALDKAIRIPSARSRESPRVAIPRSPCTSLYGAYRPTTGVSNWISASGRTIAPRRSGSPLDKTGADVEKKPAARGRPTTLSKLAVREDMAVEFVARAAKVLLLNGDCMDSNLFGQQWKVVNHATPLASFKTHKGVAVHQMMTENEKYFEVGATDRSKVKIFEVRRGAVEAFLEETGAALSLDSLDDEAELVKLREGVQDPALEEGEEGGAAESAMPMRVDDDVGVFVGEQRYSEVPLQGSARRARGFDRRAVERQAPEAVGAEAPAAADVAAAASVALREDAVGGAAVRLYNGWALDGRDMVMEVSNAPPLADTLAGVVAGLCAERGALRAVDLGCGNGWAARMVRSLVPEGTEAHVVGVDAASLMVKRARELDANGGAYEVADAAEWAPRGGEELDLALAVELLHLVEDPAAVARRVAGSLRAGGRLVVSLECYTENRLSSQWAANLGVPMAVRSEGEWVALLEAAGFVRVEAVRAAAPGPWQGMLILTAEKP